MSVDEARVPSHINLSSLRDDLTEIEESYRRSHSLPPSSISIPKLAEVFSGLLVEDSDTNDELEQLVHSYTAHQAQEDRDALEQAAEADILALLEDDDIVETEETLLHNAARIEMPNIAMLPRFRQLGGKDIAILDDLQAVRDIVLRKAALQMPQDVYERFSANIAVLRNRPCEPASQEAIDAHMLRQNQVTEELLAKAANEDKEYVGVKWKGQAFTGPVLFSSNWVPIAKLLEKNDMSQEALRQAGPRSIQTSIGTYNQEKSWTTAINLLRGFGAVIGAEHIDWEPAAAPGHLTGTDVLEHSTTEWQGPFYDYMGETLLARLETGPSVEIMSSSRLCDRVRYLVSNPHSTLVMQEYKLQLPLLSSHAEENVPFSFFLFFSSNDPATIGIIIQDIAPVGLAYTHTSLRKRLAACIAYLVFRSLAPSSTLQPLSSEDLLAPLRMRGVIQPEEDIHKLFALAEHTGANERKEGICLHKKYPKLVLLIRKAGLETTDTGVSAICDLQSLLDSWITKRAATKAAIYNLIQVRSQLSRFLAKNPRATPADLISLDKPWVQPVLDWIATSNHARISRLAVFRSKTDLDVALNVASRRSRMVGISELRLAHMDEWRSASAMLTPEIDLKSEEALDLCLTHYLRHLTSFPRSLFRKLKTILAIDARIKEDLAWHAAWFKTPSGKAALVRKAAYNVRYKKVAARTLCICLLCWEIKNRITITDKKHKCYKEQNFDFYNVGLCEKKDHGLRRFTWRRVSDNMRVTVIRNSLRDNDTEGSANEQEHREGASAEEIPEATESRERNVAQVGRRALCKKCLKHFSATSSHAKVSPACREALEHLPKYSRNVLLGTFKLQNGKYLREEDDKDIDELVSEIIAQADWIDDLEDIAGVKAAAALDTSGLKNAKGQRIVCKKCWAHASAQKNPPHICAGYGNFAVGRFREVEGAWLRYGDDKDIDDIVVLLRDRAEAKAAEEMQGETPDAS